ncbi:MAG: response regulator [Burkholderiales bacterium]|jgi:CheY-like chemotaxis protein
MTAAAVTPVILLVEDDPDHTELVRRAIEELGRDVRLVALADGEIALDYLFRRGEWADSERSPKPDLVFLDLRLPRLDGFSVLREIKNAVALRHVPVVILTSSSSDRDVEHAYAEHANSYLVKPHDYERLVTLLGRARDYWLVRNRGPRR